MASPSLDPAKLIGSLPEPIVVVSLDGVIVFANRAFARLSGSDVSNLQGRRLSEFTLTSEVELAARLDQCARTSGPIPFLVEFRGPNDHPVRCRAQGALLDRGDSRQSTTTWLRFSSHIGQGFETLNDKITLLNREIMARHAAQEAFQEREQRLRFVMEAMPQKIFTANAAGEADYVNQQWVDFTGVASVEIKGWGWAKLVHPQDVKENIARWTHCLNTGEPFQIEHRLRRADGAYRWHLTRAVPFRNQEGQVLTWIGTNTDVHDQKLADAALAKTEKLAAVGRLAATMAHEINNPLESITNLLYLVLKDSALSATARRNLTLADQELDRVAHIAKQTLGFYRENAGPSTLDISRTINELLEVYSYKFRNRAIAIHKEFDRSAKLVAPSGEFRQVFGNLFVNAVDATTDGGRIRVRVRLGRDWKRGMRGVRISVADDGCGISPEQRGRIFEAFYTTKAEVGTGLGLWLTRNIVHSHGGVIRFRSRVQGRRRGTVFTVFWPVEQKAQQTELKQAEQCAKAI